MGKKKTISYLMQRELQAKIRFGEKKRPLVQADRARQKAKLKESGTQPSGKGDHAKSPYIHGEVTAQTYMQQAHLYGKWLSNQGMGNCTLEEARQHTSQYIEELKLDKKHSASSINTSISALAKIWGVDSSEIAPTIPVKASSIKRGRTATARAAAIERNHPNLCAELRSCGLRNNKEAQTLKANQVIWDSTHTKVVAVHVKGKGGLWRTAKICEGTRGQELLSSRLQNANGNDLVFPHIYSGTNVHGFRADYAAWQYAWAMQNGKSTGELYHCRGENKGKVYDKGAIDYVNQQVGHGSGRGYTLITNYLSYGNKNNL